MKINSHASHFPTVVRLQKIANILSRGKRVTVQTIASEIEVSHKTVYRDLAYMRDQLEIPIEYEHWGRGWHFSQAVQLCACCGGKV
jgi:predicted DNA-binding transcriptional regulator YafY